MDTYEIEGMRFGFLGVRIPTIGEMEEVHTTLKQCGAFKTKFAIGKNVFILMAQQPRSRSCGVYNKNASVLARTPIAGDVTILLEDPGFDGDVLMDMTIEMFWKFLSG